MKVYLDRNHCAIEGAPCESCFASRIEKHFSDHIFDEMDIGGCVMRVEEEDKPEFIDFFMVDRDQQEKYLQVTKENWPDAYNSWMILYEKQSKISAK